jgi:hypothetical protein
LKPSVILFRLDRLILPKLLPEFLARRGLERKISFLFSRRDNRRDQFDPVGRRGRQHGGAKYN